jgi:peroxiredoxin Q/BCP
LAGGVGCEEQEKCKMRLRAIDGVVAFSLLAGAVAGGCRQSPWTSPLAQEQAASARSPIVGERAPDFTLKDQDDKDVTLSSLRGQWVVLYFYPKDDTPGCTCEATEFTSMLDSLRKINAKVYGISPDSPSSHRAFSQVYKLKLNLLSDPDHKVMTEYGAYVQASLGEKKYWRAIRTTMIVDPEGVIRYHWPEVIPKGHAERVRQELMRLQAESPRGPAG